MKRSGKPKDDSEGDPGDDVLHEFTSLTFIVHDPEIEMARYMGRAYLDYTHVFGGTGAFRGATSWRNWDCDDCN